MQLKNNVMLEIASSASTSAVTIHLTKAVAPYNNPLPTGGVLTLTDNTASPTKFEIIRYESVTDLGATLQLNNVQRALENTTAQSWAAGDVAYQAITAQQINNANPLSATAYWLSLNS